jgi:hypothetical protein
MSDDQSGNRIAQPPGVTLGGTSEAEVRQVMANFQTACRAFGPARDYDQTYDVETDLLLEAEAGVFACDALDPDLIRLQVECFARDQDPDPAVVAMVRLGLAFALTLETGRVPTPVDRYNGALKVMRMASGRGIPPAYDREFVEAQTMLLFG